MPNAVYHCKFWSHLTRWKLKLQGSYHHNHWVWVLSSEYRNLWMILLEIYGRFRKIGGFLPNSSNFNRFFHYFHHSILGYPYILGPFWYAQYKAMDADTYRYCIRLEHPKNSWNFWMPGPTYRDSRRPRIPKAGGLEPVAVGGKFASHVVFYPGLNGSSDWRCSFFYS